MSDAQETFYALRRTDGEMIGEFTWWVVEGPDDWPDWLDDYDDVAEYEIVRMAVTPIARKTLPTCCECDQPAEFWGLCEPHAREDDPSMFDDAGTSPVLPIPGDDADG